MDKRMSALSLLGMKILPVITHILILHSRCCHHFNTHRIFSLLSSFYYLSYIFVVEADLHWWKFASNTRLFPASDSTWALANQRPSIIGRTACSSQPNTQSHWTLLLLSVISTTTSNCCSCPDQLCAITHALCSRVCLNRHLTKAAHPQ